MKRLLLSVLILGLAFASHAGQISKKYNFTSPIISSVDGYDLITFENTRLSGVTGEPSLPYMPISLLLPAGEEVKLVEVIKSKPIVIKQKLKIYPKQFSRPLSEPSITQFAINKMLYSEDISYPKTPTTEVTTEFMNGYSFALGSFTPVEYNPLKQELTYYQNIEIVITTKQCNQKQNIISKIKSDAITIGKVAFLAQNDEIIKSYPQNETKTSGYELLIITPQSFETDFQTMIDNYNSIGLSSQLTTIETIQSTASGADLQEKMRNYIIQEYENNSVKYVLLGGDVEHVPYRGFYCSVQSSSVYEDDGIPADLYYSALDGSWNDDGDDKWGEIGEDDLLPDIAVGRLSFSTSDELAYMMTKSFQYQTNPVTGELTSPLLAGEHLWDDPLTWGAQYLDLIQGLHDDNGYTTNGIPYEHNIDTLYEREIGTWSGGMLINQLNEGKSFLHHVGHASQTSAMHLSNSDISMSNFAELDGSTHNYLLVYTHGCLCGSFDYNDCIAEKMVTLEKCAVAFIGNSRYGWFNEGQTEGPSQHLHREFVNALYELKETHIGEAHLLSKIATAPWVNAPNQHEEGALRWCFYDCNVLADPALQVWTDEPYTVDADYQNEIPVGTTQLNVTLNKEGVALENYRCSFIKDGVFYGADYTNENGEVLIQFDQPVLSIGQATIYVHGYNTTQSFDIEVVQSNEAFIVLNSFSINDGNNNQADYGETFGLNVNLKNFGLANATDVAATLTSSDENITVNGTELSCGAINAEDSVSINDAFEIVVNNIIPDQHSALCTLDITSNEGTWTSYFDIVLNAPILDIAFIQADSESGLTFTSSPQTIVPINVDYIYNIVVDNLSSNTNGCLDPGETANLEVTFINNGHSDSEEAICELTSSSSYITVNSASFTMGELNANSELTHSFSISVNESTPLGTAVDFTFSLDAGDYSDELTVVLKIGVLAEDFETGDFTAYNWNMSGNANWDITAIDPYEGIYSAVSGEIDNNQTSELSLTLDVLNNDSISFYKKVSSEEGWDFLKFYIDGTEVDEWSNEVPWSRESYQVNAGTHTFKWVYEKDISQSNGDDCAWIDYIELPIHASSVDFTKSTTITCPTLPTWLTFTDNGDGTASLSGTPTNNNVGLHPVYLTASNTNGEQCDQEFEINVVAPTGISNLTNELISVYPNPAKDFIIIENSSTTSNVSKINIYNANGQLVLNKTLTENKSAINISYLGSGAYTIAVKTGKKLFTKKIHILE